MIEYIDEKGRIWHPFVCSLKHELDDASFTFTIWAIDYADAVERLEFLKSNAQVDGQLLEEIDA